ncbi:MAG: extracellular solute-binding protein [Cumulibacter sp.]
MRLPKRLSLALATSAVAMLSLSACSGTGSASAGTVKPLPELSPNDEVTITWDTYNYMPNQFPEFIDSLVAQFETEHPNIDVVPQAPTNITTNTSYAAALQQAILAGNTPDVAQQTFDALHWLATQGVIDPLVDLVGQDALDESFGGEYPYNENAQVLSDLDGKTWGMPYVFSTPILWYNQSAFDELGITMPEAPTWDEIAQIGTKFLEAGYSAPLVNGAVQSGGDWSMQGVIKSNGGSIVSADKKTIEFGGDEAVGAVETMRELYDDGVLSNVDLNNGQLAMSTGAAVMYLQTANVSTTLQKGATANNWTLAATRMPSFGDKAPAPTNSGSMLVIPHQENADPKKQAAAWEFIKFLTSPAAVEAIAENIGYVPLRDTLASTAGAPLNEWYNTTPGAKVNVEQLHDLKPWDSYPGNNYAQISKIFMDAVQNSVFQGQDPKQTMQLAQEDAQALVK